MIREATRADAARLTAMAKDFHAAAGVSAPFAAAYVHARLLSLMDTGVVLVWDDQGVKGGIAGALVPDVWYAETHAVELGWWVEPSARGRAWRPLLRAFEAWAAERGADAVRFSALDDRVMRLIERMGYEPQAERHLVKRP